MKLVISIIHDDDVKNTMDTLREEGFFVTKLSSTGGFLRAGNTTLLIGVEDRLVEKVMSIFERCCKSRKELTTIETPYGGVQGYVSRPIEIVVGGATVFVVDVSEFRKF
ncbi:hypothetical protein B5E58_07995 [Tyzzerella sp. An114]|uniref:cyclic-di-AMP receptor n=1 Tax=Tyzzerella sp. An114 TaxID=1965545 RepID=UPI000B4438A7|nr:cyclic-di-AMP receptor [Tyzzerella sp. An114]OUQ58546.1 hypothetical protein B5E58_07995 [Tyzzerella sp. An114]HIT72451.1 cyclic-di-AMP receptor [Candidatus Fimicola cottocaccae]